MVSTLGTHSFSLLGSFNVPPDTRLVKGACNPEKDLALLIHRSEPRNTISLWKLQGVKRWEIDVIANFDQVGSIRHIAWSPDGSKFAVSHHVKRLTVHSLLDGCEEFRYTETTIGEQAKPGQKIAALTWIKMPWTHFWNTDISKQPPSQLYRRGYDDPGSALYLLRALPELDYKEPLVEKPSPTELSSSHRAPRLILSLPAHNWPSLFPNPSAASIAAESVLPNESSTQTDSNKIWYSLQSNTCLFAGDSHGSLYPFLHGTYATGAIESKPTFSSVSSIVTAKQCAYFSKLSSHAEGVMLDLHELDGLLYASENSLTFSLDQEYQIRRVLRISSATKELVLYAARNIEEARIAWSGGGGREGARDQNEKWCRMLETMQARQDPPKVKGAKADLMNLLMIGIPLTTCLSDHLQNGSQTTERNFKKWKSTVGDTLSHIKRVIELSSVAIQRTVILLRDLQGLAEMDDVARHFLLNRSAIQECIDAAETTLETLSLLVETIRRENRGFHHFMIWLRGLIPNLPPQEYPQKAYDVIVVNDYISNGLFPSSIDPFFSPPLELATRETETKPAPGTLIMVATDAREYLKRLKERRKNDAQTLPQASHQQLSTQCSIGYLVSELGSKCNLMFQNIASAITSVERRTVDGASVSRLGDCGLYVRRFTEWKSLMLPPGVKQSLFREESLQIMGPQDTLLRETIVTSDTGARQYILLRLPVYGDSKTVQNLHPMKRTQSILVMRLIHERDPAHTVEVAAVIFSLILTTNVSNGESEEAIEESFAKESIVADALDVQFYDDTHFAIVLQTKSSDAGRILALVDYASAAYHVVKGFEDVIDVEKDIIRLFMDSTHPTRPIELGRSCIVPSLRGGDSVSLSVNSKRGVALLLDHQAGRCHAYDLTSDEGMDETIDDGQTRDETSSTVDEENSMVM